MDNSILSDKKLLLENVPTFGSVYDIGMNWLAPPESTNSGSGLDLTFDEASKVFAPYNESDVNASASHTLLNPDNMYHFYYVYNFGNTLSLAPWLGIAEGQIENLKGYLDW